MNPLFKKKLIALLLFICCLLCGWLLLASPSAPEKKFTRLAQIDSLINRVLYDFHIQESQITHNNTIVDSTFNRKTFEITANPLFPKVQLHLSLKGSFQPYGISVPAKVLFPDRDLLIHFYYEGTIIRTLLIDVE